jgi:hypothetical protein
MAERANRRKKSLSTSEVFGPMGTNAALAGPIVADAQIQPGFSFTPELDRLFAAGFPHLILLGPEQIPDEKLGEALVNVLSKKPYAVVWPGQIALGLVRLLPVRGAGALVPGTTTLTDQGRAILADTRDVGEDEAEALFSKAISRFFYAGAMRDALLLFEAAMGPHAVLVLARAMQGLSKEQLYARPELAEVLHIVPSMLLRTSRAVHDEALQIFRAIFERHADRPHRSTLQERRAIDLLDLLVNGEEARRRRYPQGVGHGDLAFVPGSAADALASYERFAASGPGAYGPDVRRVFLAGKQALDVEARWIAEYTGNVTSTPEILLDTFGLVNDPRTVDLLLRLYTRRPLAKRIDAWMQRHAGLAIPALERIADGGERAALAAEQLAKLRKA